MDEAIIIAGLIQQDYQALDDLIENFGPVIIRTIHGILNQPQEYFYQKEAENETFFRIWQKISQFDPERAQFSTWLVMIARSVSLDIKRKLIKRQKLEPVLNDSHEATEFVVPEAFSQESFLNLVNSLELEDQLIFLKRYFYQEKPVEIGEALGLTTETIYNRLSRGRKKLKEVLKNEKNI